MREALPDWNDLPPDLRDDLVKLAEAECCRFCAEAVGGDLAVNFYERMHGALPATTFPLFDVRRQAEGPRP